MVSSPSYGFSWVRCWRTLLEFGSLFGPTTCHLYMCKLRNLTQPQSSFTTPVKVCLPDVGTGSLPVYITLSGKQVVPVFKSSGTVRNSHYRIHNSYSQCSSTNF